MKRQLSVLLLALCAPFSALSADAPAAVPDRSAIETVVREYILQHPEVIAQAATLYQQRQQAAQRSKSQEEITSRLADLQRDPSSPFTGPAGGTTVVEFFDYHCGYCRRAEPAVQELLAAHPEVKLVFKEFPILGPESTLAAKAALAAAQQGGYLAFHRGLMATAGSLSMETIEQLATKEKLDVGKLKRDMESPEIAAILARNRDLALHVGVTATPSFIVGSELLPGALDTAVFEKLVARSKPSVVQSAAHSPGVTNSRSR